MASFGLGIAGLDDGRRLGLVAWQPRRTGGGGAGKNPNLLPLSLKGKDTAGNIVVPQKIEKAGKLVKNPKFKEQLINENKLRELALKKATEQENLFIGTLFMVVMSTVINIPSISIWAFGGSVIRFYLNNIKLKKIIEWLLALLLIATAISVFLYKVQG